MLTEHDVQTLWRQLFQDQEINGQVIKKAQGLLNALSTESPLRLRLTTELEAIRTRKK